jgi:hypothetical protein
MPEEGVVLQNDRDFEPACPALWGGSFNQPAEPAVNGWTR